MSKKLVTGAVIALAAGIAAYLYKKNKNKVDDAASDAYGKINDGIEYAEDKLDNIFS